MEKRDNPSRPMPHQLILQERNQLEMSGVEDVQNFDDTVVRAYTSLGEVVVSGNELHIRRLDLENGSFSVEGQVDSIVYVARVKGGFWNRLLR